MSCEYWIKVKEMKEVELRLLEMRDASNGG